MAHTHGHEPLVTDTAPLSPKDQAPLVPKDPATDATMVVVWDGYLVVLCKDGTLWASVQKGPLYEPPLAWHRLQAPADLPVSTPSVA